MRSTGLFDKCGNEIFIGDIVKDSYGFIGTVVFSNGAFRYDVENGKYLCYNSSLLFKEISKKADVIIVGKSKGRLE